MIKNTSLCYTTPFSAFRLQKPNNWTNLSACARMRARHTYKKNRTPNGVRFSYVYLFVNSLDYSAAASVAGASTGASALGAAFLPARRVVFLAAALGALSMFSL